jgi:hypothetical protein
MLLAVVDANMVFRWVDFGEPGSVGDAHVWNKSDYKRMLLLGMFDLPHLPNGRPAVEINGREILSDVACDAAFALLERVLKCHESPLTAADQAFNTLII